MRLPYPSSIRSPMLRCRRHATLLLIGLFTINLAAQPPPTELGGFDLSPDDATIVFSCQSGSSSSLYRSVRGSSHAEPLLAAAEGYSYYNPAFSPDGRQIAFVRARTGTTHAQVCLAYADGHSVAPLTGDSQIVTEVAFASSGDEVLFVAAREFAAYSPLAHAAAHGCDLYAVSVRTKQMRRLTTLDAYGLSGLCVAPGRIYFREEAEPDSGLAGIAAGADHPAVERIPAPRSPRPGRQFMYRATWSSRRREFVFVMPYEIYATDADWIQARRLFRSDSQIHLVRCFHQKDAILFSYQGSMSFHVATFDGSPLEKITPF